MKILTRKGQRPSTDTVKKYDETSLNARILAGLARFPRVIPSDRLAFRVFPRSTQSRNRGCVDSGQVRQPRCSVSQSGRLSTCSDLKCATAMRTC